MIDEYETFEIPLFFFFCYHEIEYWTVSTIELPSILKVYLSDDIDVLLFGIYNFSFLYIGKTRNSLNECSRILSVTSDKHVISWIT